jgi:hypothetical protein
LAFGGKYSVIKKYYFSDGANSHHKNRIGLIKPCHHGDDFIIKAKWQFCAASLSKDPNDGIGGTAETAAERAGLQRRIQDQTITPLVSYPWVESNLKGIIFRYTNTIYYSREAKALQ